MKVVRKKHRRVGTKRGVKEHVMETAGFKSAVTKFGYRVKTTVGANLPDAMRKRVAGLYVLGEAKAHREAGNHRLADIAHKKAMALFKGHAKTPPIGNNKASTAYFLRPGIRVNRSVR